MPTPTTSFGGVFGTYDSLGGNMLTRTRTQLLANLNALKNLIPDPTAGGVGTATTVRPDFDLIHPATAQKLRAEIDAIIDYSTSKTAAAASPV